MGGGGFVRMTNLAPRVENEEGSRASSTDQSDSEEAKKVQNIYKPVPIVYS